MKYKFLFLLLFSSLAMFTSCKKENSDITSVEDNGVEPLVVVCNLTLDIVEDPAGTLTANPAGGTAPYAYSWSSGETTNPISVSSSDTYTLTITDTQGCVIVEDVEVILPTTCISFTTEIVEEPNGTLSTNSSGGILPYVYNWSTGETSDAIRISTNGSYVVTVTDNEGCIATDSIEVTVTVPCQSFTAQLTENPSGTLTVTPSGGTFPYAYNWSTRETTNTITVSSNGTYSVTVTDSQGCVVSKSIDVDLSNTCQSFTTKITEDPMGTLTATTSGGTPPYAYRWSTGATTNTITVSNSGTYSVTVIDAQGCVVVDEIEI